MQRAFRHFNSPAAGWTTTAFVTAILLAAASPPAAQTLTSRVEGTVQDQAGGVIPGAAVTMTEVDTNVVRDAFTDDRGLYLFPLVPAGTYRVEAAVPGFGTTVIDDVRVVLSAPTSIDIVLAVGGVTETVIVSAAEAQSLMNTVNAEINTNLTREQVSELR